MFDVVFTTINACLALFSLVCAVVSVRYSRKQTQSIASQAEAALKQLEITSKQTEIAQKQLEESCKPDYPLTMRLESIARSIQRLDSTIKDTHNT